MSKRNGSAGDRVYGALLRLLPFDFRSEFGSEMEEVFREQREEAGRGRGIRALFHMWWTTAVDIFRMAPREHLSVLAQDTRYALRMMRRNAGYTAAAVLILGLGIGMNTSIFSAVHAVLMKPLPYLQGDGLVVLRQPATRQGLRSSGFSPLELDDYRQRNHSLSELVEYHSMSFTLLGGAEAQRVRTGVVSAGFFDFLGVKPLLGRTFRPEDEGKDAQPVLVLSYEFWRKQEHGDPNIVGRVYRMNDRPHIAIGVLPPIPQYPNENDVYMTTTSCPFRSNPQNIARRGFRIIASVFGRLKPGITVEYCTRDMASIAATLKHEYAAANPDSLGLTGSATSLREELTQQARPMLLALLAAAGFVLLIACANVANLMLARMARREQELVIRTAVGAGSGRLLRQLLTESLLMALLAATVGVVFAAASGKLLAEFTGQYTARAREIALDGWALAFAIGCAAITTVAFGSMAALYSRHDVASGLKEGGRASSERRRNLLRGGLITAQVAFSFVLLTGAGLMVRSFLRLQAVDPGFVPQRVFAASFSNNWSKYNGAAVNQQFRDFTRRLLDRVQSQPGVVSAAASSGFPMHPNFKIFGGAPTRILAEGDSKSDDGINVRNVRAVTPAYFQTLGIPLLSGRSFQDSDREESPQVVVINRALASKRWGREDPVGRRISLDNGAHWAQIVGVVGDVKEFGPEADSPYEVYLAIEQSPTVNSVLVRTSGDPSAAAGLVRRAIFETDPEAAITAFEPLSQAKDEWVQSPRTLTRVFSIFAALAFVIALGGIGGMLALWVRQRRREIGIRMALGAAPQSIVRQLIGQGMLLVAIGLALGAVGAFEVTRLMKTLLFQVEPTDPATFVLMAAVLLGAALLACLLPARRAAGIDPLIALRCD
jgi:putative ABC transport system permease protein